jgi:hypothetical protein
MIMYRVIRCPGCHTFTYADHFQRWKLCYVCGEAIDIGKAPLYLEVHDYVDAERIVDELEKYLHKTGKSDLSGEEKENLRREYARWMRMQL